ncbi:sugar ABC transporter permease [Microbacterium lacus]|uniref:Sugar ABC transporter permease n=2 Tax=Microbacterium lacus TaxID=415217 RepID=A0ABP4TEI4_9MICO
MIVVGLLPIGYAVWMSVSNQSPTAPSAGFVGLANYVAAVFTPAFGQALLVTLILVVFGLIIQFTFGYLLASLLHRQMRGYQIARSILLVPMLLTPVIVGLIFKFIFSPDLGIIFFVQQAIGVNLPWFSDPAFARGLILIIDAWMHIPFVMLMLLAGMASMPQEPLESASIDGAGWWQTLRYITLPMLAPIITITLLVRTVDTARLFDIIYTSTEGGPGLATVTASLSAYERTFQFYEFGQGAAMAVALAVIMFPVYFLYVRLTKV